MTYNGEVNSNCEDILKELDDPLLLSFVQEHRDDIDVKIAYSYDDDVYAYEIRYYVYMSDELVTKLQLVADWKLQHHEENKWYFIGDLL